MTHCVCVCVCVCAFLFTYIFQLLISRLEKKLGSEKAAHGMEVARLEKELMEAHAREAALLEELTNLRERQNLSPTTNEFLSLEAAANHKYA